MFDKKIVMFNRYENKWYPTEINGVDLITDRANVIARFGETSDGRAVLHILVKDGLIGGKTYTKPKSWNALLDPSNNITFQSGIDFFVEGYEVPDNTAGYIDDDDYAEGFYSAMKTAYDDVYMVVSVGQYYAIPHFEIIGK